MKIRTRKEIEQDKRDNEAAILKLQDERRELNKEATLLCDEEQWFTEKEEEKEIREGRKKVIVKHLVGRIHWNEDFIDEDTGDFVTITRSRVVRINGEWQ